MYAGDCGSVGWCDDLDDGRLLWMDEFGSAFIEDGRPTYDCYSLLTDAGASSSCFELFAGADAEGESVTSDGGSVARGTQHGSGGAAPPPS